MNFVRPALAADLRRYGEVMVAAAVTLAGVLIAAQGGLILVPSGGILALAGGGWTVTAIRSAVFRGPVRAPGIVDVDEGQIGYLGPSFGGYVALADLAELRIVTVAGHRQWRLRTTDGQVLLIPVAAKGAEALHDAFAVLAGIDMTALARALAGPPKTSVLWSRGPSRPLPEGSAPVASITRIHDGPPGGPSRRT